MEKLSPEQCEEIRKIVREEIEKVFKKMGAEYGSDTTIY